MEPKTFSWMPAGSRPAIAAVRVPRHVLPLTKAEWLFRLADLLADPEAEDVLRGALAADEADFVLAPRRPLDRAERLLMLESVRDRLEAESEGQAFPVAAMAEVGKAATALKVVGLAEWISAVIRLGDPR